MPRAKSTDWVMPEGFPLVVKKNPYKSARYYTAEYLTLLECKRGSGLFLCDSEMIPFKPGSILVAYPGSTFGLLYFKGSELTCYVLDVESIFDNYSYFFDSTTVSLFHRFPFLTRHFNCSKLTTLLHYMADEIKSHGISFENRATAYWFNITGIILDSMTKEAVPTVAPATMRRIMPALTKILASPGKKLTVKELAEYAYLSESYLRVLFDEVYGCSPMDFMGAVRMEYSKHLLTTDLSVKEISAMVGYNGLASFNRYFKLYTGTTPDKWRKELV